MSGVRCAVPAARQHGGADGELAVWWVQDGECRRAPFAQALAEIRAPWRLYLPVEAVTACAVNLPTQKARWLRQSLPFAVEEQLADDVEQMHLALGPALADGRHRVFAVQRTWLAAWLALAEGAGKAPASLHVDADCLPGEGSCLFWLEERWLLGGSGAVRLACGSEDWPVLRDSCPPPQRAFAAQEVAPLEGWKSGPGGQSARLAERAAAGHRPGPGRVRRAPAEQPVAPLAAAAGVGRAVVGIAMGLHPGPGLAVAARRRPLRGAERRTLPPVVSRGPQADQPARAVRPAPGRQRQQRRRGPVARPAWPGRHGDRRRADGERRATGLQRRSRRRRPSRCGLPVSTCWNGCVRVSASPGWRCSWVRPTAMARRSARAW